MVQGMQKKTIKTERASSELSFVIQQGFENRSFESLDFWQCEYRHDKESISPNDDKKFLYDLIYKILHRGERTFTTWRVEKLLLQVFGKQYNIQAERGKGSISYSFNPELKSAYRSFIDFAEPWQGVIDDVVFDPNQPKNERRFFAKLVDHFGPKIVHYLYTQSEISTILPPGQADNFMAQRLDFYLAFPNGRALIIEPGDHDDLAQQRRDKERDQAFLKLGVKTIRPRNAELDDETLYRKIEQELEMLDAQKYLRESDGFSDDRVAVNNLFLLPSLIARIETVLSFYFLQRDLISHSTRLTVGIYERDIAVAEWAVFSFIDRLNRIARLYGIILPTLNMELRVVRATHVMPSLMNCVRRRLNRFGVSVVEAGIGDITAADLVLDVAIKANALTSAIDCAASNFASIRNSYRHNGTVRFSYLSPPRPAINLDDISIAVIIRSFLQDFFRKPKLRDGQLPIIKSVLRQKNTIGLLPTSGGKSICYQLCALLTPGTSIVVDPIVALMKDQVEGLRETFKITHITAWYAGSKIKDDEAGRILAENIIIFLSPERFLRRTFRDAMQGLPGADVYINYAVVDEAHCVSMWGHDFRPAYLSLARNFRAHCNFQGRTPVIVALTGTASQLVLIDLKRELGIEDLDAIIRPKTFDRPELDFSIHSTSAKNKDSVLKNILDNLPKRLNVRDLSKGAQGIVFAYTRKKVWEIFGHFVGNAPEYIRAALTTDNIENLQYGIYCGKMPDGMPLNASEWDHYKDRTLKAFKRGHIRLLIGNTAVSVGIDSEDLNYIVNYSMPQSMEGYYQQCGRAGRRGQHSECILIFSDDRPDITKRWLNDSSFQMPIRWDDIGTVAYFHNTNFPGIETDVNGCQQVFQRLFNPVNEDGGWVLVNRLSSGKSDDDPTEKYIAYGIMLGVIRDYEVQGIGANVKYRVRLSDEVEGFLKTKEMNALQQEIITALHAYLERYQPIAKSIVEADIERAAGDKFSERAIRYLVSFIYGKIAYQRKTATGRMWEYCNQKDKSSQRLRAIIKDYFDQSKFSMQLEHMATSAPTFVTVWLLVEKIETVDDIEHLYWETSRLLDERYRPDWAAIRLIAVLYRERKASESAMHDFMTMIDNLRETPQIEAGEVSRFIGGILSAIPHLYKKAGYDLGIDTQNTLNMLSRFVESLYDKYGLTYLPIIDDLQIELAYKDRLHNIVVRKQMEELKHVAEYTRVTGGMQE